MQNKLPAYPLFVKDPYFSFWTNGDILTDCNVMLWTGAKKPMLGKVQANGREFRFLGRDSAPALAQTTRSVTAFTTDYTFDCDLFSLSLSFVSPLPLDDLDTLSCPVCRLSYEIVPKQKLSDVKITFAVCENVCYDGDEKKPCRAGILRRNGYEAAYIGLRNQAVLSHSSDLFGADWGVYYLCGESGNVFERDGFTYICAENAAMHGYFMLAFDDIASIYYYGQILRGYYFRNGDKNICDAIEDSYAGIEETDRKLKAFDEQLRRSTEKYGEEYYRLCAASLRQSIAAHKLVADAKGRILFLSKECNSDGCVATVDVTFPSAPLYLLYNPELVRGMMRPIFDFARMPIWKYDFAPHDAGMYPYVTGQLYAAQNGEQKYNKDIYVDFAQKEVLPFYYLMGAETQVYTDERQMQIEESANMLILCYACYLADGQFDFIDENFDLLDKWGDYLCVGGPEYGRQLCTDDFAGHLTDGLNLAIKATIALKAYARILAAKGDERAAKVEQTVAEHKRKIEGQRCADGHLPIAFCESEDTYSLKYNLVFDKVFGFGIFSPDLFVFETEYYAKIATKYGTPLDSRLRTTKADWLLWCASLDDGREYAKKVMRQVGDFLVHGKERYPFPDWYDADTATAKEFRNRTVTGGLFMPLLKDRRQK